MSKNTSLVFLSGKRTPFGANGGTLKDLTPTELAVSCSRAALQGAQVAPDSVDHVIFGSVIYTTPDSIYCPRHTGLKVGIPDRVPALGINRLCGTGFQVVIEAYQQMLTGDTRVALVGGVENMSAAPYVLRGARFGVKMGHQKLSDSLQEGLTDAYAQMPMAMTAENLADRYGITREQCDAFALQSQKRYAAALAAGCFQEEISPVTLTGKKGESVAFASDEHPRSETTSEGLAKLKALFKEGGTVTAGTASGIVDGAAALVVADERHLSQGSASPLGRLVSFGVSGCDPKIMGIGPVPAAKIALAKAGLSLAQMDLIEVNEAFAAQTLAVQKELEIDPARLNVTGGAIAVGHPLAASGTRITMRALYELRRRKQKYALVSACIGGGQGIALILEAFH